MIWRLRRPRLFRHPFFFLFFFNDTATTEIYTLSLHDALPIWPIREADIARCSRYVSKVPLTEVGGPYSITSSARARSDGGMLRSRAFAVLRLMTSLDRKSTRLNSSHLGISYAVFCLKKKKKTCVFHTHQHMGVLLLTSKIRGTHLRLSPYLQCAQQRVWSSQFLHVATTSFDCRMLE